MVRPFPNAQADAGADAHADAKPLATDRGLGSTISTMLVGCSGWSIHGSLAQLFPGHGSHLQRYARRMAAAEITSSFYKEHRRSTYERWAASVPRGFRFAVKIPREITHDRALVGAMPAFERFLDQSRGLGDRLGPLLVQLPPSLAFDARRAGRFLAAMRRRHAGAVACEPRHPSWFAPIPDRLLAEHRVARVAADPARVPQAAVPGGWRGLAYVRLHGSPVMYRSSYDDAFLRRIADACAQSFAESGAPAWCIFDNTMLNAALANALTLMRMDGSAARRKRPT